jgi:mRNA interferase MazF
MKIKKFHIYLADLNPRLGTEPGKVRPVVVVQTDMLNHTHPSTVILPVTSNVIPGTSILRVHLPKEETNLDKDSDIIIDQIRAIDNRRFIKHIGELQEEQKRKILESLKIILLE